MKSSKERFEVFSTARGTGSFGFAEGGRPGTIPPRNSIALRSIAAFSCAGLFCIALWPACGSSGTGMMNSDGGQDLAGPKDLASPPPDLSPPKLTQPANCAAATVNATMVYNSVFKPRCSNGNCHGGPLLPSLKSATDLPLMVGQASASDFPYVDATFDINRSYILYKLTGEQRKVPHGGGDAMPPSGGLIDDPSLCMVINWIKGGAK